MWAPVQQGNRGSSVCYIPEVTISYVERVVASGAFGDASVMLFRMLTGSESTCKSSNWKWSSAIVKDQN